MMCLILNKKKKEIKEKKIYPRSATVYVHTIGKLCYLDRMTPNTRWVSEGSCLSPKGEGRTPPDTPPSIGGSSYQGYTVLLLLYL